MSYERERTQVIAVKGTMVSKRLSGRRVKFNVEKLRLSVSKAVLGAGLSSDDVEDIVVEVLKSIEGRGEVSTREISDLVEKAMISRIIRNPKWEEAAKRYLLARIYNQVYGKGKWRDFDPKDLELTYNALKLLEIRYLLKDPETGRIKETPQMLFRRVARHLARVEYLYGKSEEEVKKIEDEFYRILSELRFIPNSPTLMNAETRLGILSACFVIPVRDALTTPDGEGIMDAVRATALIQQQGGGTGFDFSELRPKGDMVASTAGVASGPLSFMKLFDTVTDVIKQGGRRRGANMGVMHVWHPDIEEFIKAKTGEAKERFLQNFNISVGVYDKFMEAVLEGREWRLVNPRKTFLRPGEHYDSRYYAIVRARHSIDEEWVQEIILDELEEHDWTIPLDESLIITLDEAYAIAENENAITKTVNARQLFYEIVKGAWEGGDPGMLFMDEINRRHPVWYLGKITATNPCVSGDTRILTPQGWKTAKEVYEEARRNGIVKGVAVDEELLGEGGEPYAYKTRIVTVTGKALVYKTLHGDVLELDVPQEVEAWVWHVGRKPGVRIVSREGFEITVTRDHKFLTPNGWKKAEELKPGDTIYIARIHPSYANIVKGEVNLDPDIAFALGWLVGDGTLNQHYVAWYFGHEDRIAEERVRAGIEKLGGNPLSHTYKLSESEYKIQYNKGTKVYNNVLKLVGRLLERSRERTLPEIVWKLTPQALAAFLRGLFTADGYVDSDKAIRLTSSSRKLLEQVQILLTTFGIYSVIYERPYEKEFKYITKDGEEKTYKAKGYYELVIKGYSRRIFKELIGFEDLAKTEKLLLRKTKRDKTWITVEKVEDAGMVDFYDFTVPVYHKYIANGFVNHNCGEEPLLPWENCNLGSINLEKYVVYGKDGEPHVDWEGLARDIRIAVRFLDNVIDANKHPLKQIEEANKRTRKIGLGVMGWAHMLVKLGVRYDSVDAVYLAYHLAEWIAYNAYLASIELAMEKGVFPAWNPKLYRPMWWTARSLTELLETAGIEDKPSEKAVRLVAERPEVNWGLVEKLMYEHGLRNAALLSIAPTGSISIIAGTTSSIEPIFALAFMRHVSVGTFLEVDRLFLEYLRRYEMDEPELIEEIAKTGSIAHLPFIPRTLKKLFRTAHDIEPVWHILHQAAWQQWIDAAVSKTINMRYEASVEDVWNAYILAWKLGCKGITVYRDKSRREQVIYFGLKTQEKEREKKEKAEAEKPVIVKDVRTRTKREQVVETRITPKRFRIGKKEYIAVSEEYAGGCPTCDI